MTIGIPKRQAEDLELSVDGEKARKAIRALSMVYPAGMRADELMRICGFGEQRPQAFISFCIMRTRIDSALSRLGWKIARTDGTTEGYCRLMKLAGR